MANLLIERFKKFLVVRKSDKVEEKINDFIDYINGRYTKDVIYDEIMDFLDIITVKPTRWQSFAKYIEHSYPKDNYKRVLDVGCGPLAELSMTLLNMGYDVTGIDPKADEVMRLKIIKEYFDHEKTNVRGYDLIVGLEPCEATEHIIMGSIKNKIPCTISLCASNHDSIDGKKFISYEDWHNYLVALTNNEGTLEEVKVLGKRHTILSVGKSI